MAIFRSSPRPTGRVAAGGVFNSRTRDLICLLYFPLLYFAWCLVGLTSLAPSGEIHHSCAGSRKSAGAAVIGRINGFSQVSHPPSLSNSCRFRWWPTSLASFPRLPTNHRITPKHRLSAVEGLSPGSGVGSSKVEDHCVLDHRRHVEFFLHLQRFPSYGYPG